VAGIEGVTSIEGGELLFREARGVRKGCIVEIGSYRGRSTVCLACGSRKGEGKEIFSIETHKRFNGALGAECGPEDSKHFYKSMIFTKSYDLVSLVNLSSKVASKYWNKK
jgi:hypothetical protein